MVWLGAGTLFLIVLVVALYGLANASRESVGKALAIVAVVVLAILGIVLAITGKFFAALPILASAAAGFAKLHALARLFGARASWQGHRSQKQGQASSVDTSWLQMTLDHDSGDLDGNVLQGRYAGQRLSLMDEASLHALLQELRQADEESTRLLEAYMDRVLGPDWRAKGGDETGKEDTRSRQGHPSDAQMSETEALNILGLSAGANADDIRRAHRSLMKKLHPDHGGNSYFAAKLNAAKDFLLSQHGHKNTDT